MKNPWRFIGFIIECFFFLRMKNGIFKYRIFKQLINRYRKGF